MSRLVRPISSVSPLQLSSAPPELSVLRGTSTIDDDDDDDDDEYGDDDDDLVKIIGTLVFRYVSTNS